MRKLSGGQNKALSEISGNIAVAWFAAGVISPVFSREASVIALILKFLVSLLLATLFSIASVYLVKEIK